MTLRRKHFRSGNRVWALSYMKSFIALCLVALFSSCGGVTTGGSKSASNEEPKTVTISQSELSRIRNIMVPLLNHMDHPMKPSEVGIALIDSKEINAANAGGGKFYITTGLLQRASDNELRGVLAHEIAHEDLGHVAKTRALGTGLQIGSVILDQIIPGSGLIAPTIADFGVLKPFSRKEEYEADAHGVEIMDRAGFNGKQIMAGTLSWLLQTSGPSGGFLANHPETEDRITRVRGM